MPLVFVAFVGFGIWRTMREPHIYRAATTVRIENATAPIAGVQTSAPTYDYRIDPMASEQQVIKSRMVAERVVNALGLRLRIVDARTGGHAPFGRLVLRYAGYLVSTLPLGLGYLWMLWDRRRQT